MVNFEVISDIFKYVRFFHKQSKMTIDLLDCKSVFCEACSELHVQFLCSRSGVTNYVIANSNGS